MSPADLPSGPPPTDLLAAAARYLPGGSAWMWTLPPELAFVIERGEGSRIWDTRGRSRIDYVLSAGPLLLGHAHPVVVAAVQAQAARGSTFHWLSEPTIRLAELICRAVPCAERVRFASSGTEATMLAIRMARVFTQREKVLKLEGGWHGLHDYALVGNWHPGEAPYPTPGSAWPVCDADRARAVRLGHELIRRGVLVIPGAKMYLSLAHDERNLAETLGAFDDALGRCA